MTGYSVSDVKDHPFWDIFLTPGESKTIETLLNELQAGISPNRHKDYWLTRTRGRRFIEWTYSAVKDTTGSVKYIIGTGIDATDRKQAEEALRDSEERFRLIAETSIDVIFQTDLQGSMTYCSPSISRFGYRADAIVNSHFNDYVPTSELQKVSATFDRVRSGERIDLFELRLCKADGSRVHCEISATPMTKEGRLTGVQGIVRDISARKKIEEDLRMATEDLEFRVLERTADLVKANEDLAKEIAERQDIEKHITATNELLKLFTQTLLRNEYLDKIAVLLRGCLTTSPN